MERNTQDIKISDKLIEVGDDTWQIRNLAGISRREEKVHINTPKPNFDEVEPKSSFHFSRLFWSSVAGLIGAAVFNNSFPFLLGIGIGLYLFYESNAEAKNNWLERKQQTEKHLKAWQKLVDNPPIVYSLAIETNSGSRPVFYSFDKDGIGRIVQGVKEAMNKPGSVQATYNITTLGETNINQLGAEILNQTISEIK